MVQRWIFTDSVASEVWEVPINPREMSSPFVEKSISMRQTTAVDGRTLLFEGSPPAPQWTFSGRILSTEHYEELLRWSEKRNRITITDHFGRIIECYIQRFDPTPRRAHSYYWSHDYTMTVLVLAKPTAPTVGV